MVAKTSTAKSSTAKTPITEAPPIYDDEIDLRAIALTLWKARRVIVYATLAAVVITFVASLWVLPRKYQATAYVFIGSPVVDLVEAGDFSGFTISPTLPDIKAVVELAAAPGVLESVLKDPSVAAAFGDEEITISGMTEMVAASDLGKDQLSLQVTDTDPRRAALIANVWAERVTDTVNATYGLGAISQTLDSQVLQSQKDYNQSQAALEDALSKNQVNALSAQLDSRKSDLDRVLGTITRSRLVLDDLQFFEQGLSGLSGETPLSLGDGLALTTLRQRSLTVASESFIVQIDSASFAGFTVSKALEAAAQMRAGLQAQLTRLESDQNRLEGEIPQLQKSLSNAAAQLTEFSMKRDQSQGLYAALLKQQQQVATVLEQSAKVAAISIEAVPPDKKSSPKVLLNTILAGMIGLMLSAFGTLAMNWWKNE
ncbi:MAG: Wzz/FepE/Etk N-terminal domain-containing protein [Anaerolineales bacterium]|nr:Wzz/FepE/Etk N-terminal domain-containing protein [Anaerolineales bacterium]